MKNWFRTQPAGVASPEPLAGYNNGRLADRSYADGEAATDLADIKAAYERGRQREREARRGSPLAMTLVVLALLFAGGFIYLSVRQGSFSGGGAVVDQKLDKAAQTIDAPIKKGAMSAGEALEKAGRSLK